MIAAGSHKNRRWLTRFLFVIFLSSSIHIVKSQPASLSIDTIFGVDNQADSALARKCTFIAATIIDSLQSNYKYRFIRNFSSSAKQVSELELRGRIVIQNNMKGAPPEIHKNFYGVNIMVRNRAKQDTIYSTLFHLKDKSVLQNDSELKTSLTSMLSSVFEEISPK
jgi:hypothetical protein